MQITVVAVVCHALANITTSVCHEEIVTKQDMSIMSCMVGQPQIALWKEHTIYRGEQWTIARIKCIPGDYEPKDSV